MLIAMNKPQRATNKSFSRRNHSNDVWLTILTAVAERLTFTETNEHAEKYAQGISSWHFCLAALMHHGVQSSLEDKIVGTLVT